MLNSKIHKTKLSYLSSALFFLIPFLIEISTAQDLANPLHNELIPIHGVNWEKIRNDYNGNIPSIKSDFCELGNFLSSL